MTQLTPEHFELHDKNKAEQYQRQKMTHLEDKIKIQDIKMFKLEKKLESHAKILARFQMTEGEE